MAATAGVRPYIQTLDKLVFVSLDEEAHINFAALLPILLGPDCSYAQWQTKYYTAYLTWHLPTVEADLLSSLASSDDAVTLYIIGFSHLSPDMSQQLGQALCTGLPLLLIYFVSSSDDDGDGHNSLPDLDLSLDQELFTLKLPADPNLSDDERHAYWRSELDQALEPLPLATRYDDPQGIRALVEYLNVFDWKSKENRAGRRNAINRKLESQTVNDEDEREKSLTNLEHILSQIEEARANALSGSLSDYDRRERATVLFSQLMTVLDLGSLDE